MRMIGTMIRFARRQLHTIVSREIIKPSSPTHSHLKTQNLSLIDQIFSPNMFIPMVVFYPSTSIYRSSNEKTLDLKKSLSHTLTKYYPFAGRHAKFAPAYVDCNDEGIEFVEASVDSKLVDFLHNSQHEDFDDLFPYGRVPYESNHDDHDLVIPLAVQVNHFECGGVAMAVSLSHKIADASSLVHFINDWAKMTKFGLKASINPNFIHFQEMNIKFKGFSFKRSYECVTRSFVFPNSKINDLKLIVTTESRELVTNLTRVEVLSWLIYKCIVDATIKNNPGFKSVGAYQTINIRRKLMDPLPETTIGNFSTVMEILSNNESSEIKPEWFISEMKKQKMQREGIRNIETIIGLLSSMASKPGALEEHQRKNDNAFLCTSLCRYPAYEIDFGWGKPVKVTRAGNLRENFLVLMDSPNKDGIEALVSLKKQDMAIFQTNSDLLAFC